MSDQSQRPTLDGRDRDAIVSHIKEIAPNYVETWDPDRDDAGTALVDIAGDIVGEVVEKLDRVPKKHRAAFLDSLGFETLPPEPAQTILSFTVDDAVTIDPRTAAVTESTADRPEQRFETATDQPVQMTPATLEAVYATDPGTDRLLDHSDLAETDAETELFTGQDQQRHEYYLGHGELFTLNPGSTIAVSFETNAPEGTFRNAVEWEYYGTDDDGEEGWHSLTVPGRVQQSVSPLSTVQQVESFLDRREDYLRERQFARSPGHDGTLLRAVTDDVLKGRFGSPRDRDADSETAALPRALFEGVVEDEAVLGRLQQGFDSLQSRLKSTVDTQFRTGLRRLSVSLEIPGEMTETSVDGVESRWIRCRIPDGELAPPLFDVLVDSPLLAAGAQTETDAAGLAPGMAVMNDIVLDTDGAGVIQPLGEMPTSATSFHLACEEAFTKPGAAVAVEFSGATNGGIPPDADPSVVWEYWNGNGWCRLSVDDDTERLTTDGTVEFDVPSDLAVTSVLGHEYHWVRARLVSGNYGEVTVEQTDETNWERVRDHISPPTYQEITIQYDQSGVVPTHQRTHNSLTYREVPANGEFRPFRGLDGDRQTLYLGFDGPLTGGPMQLYLPLTGAVYPDVFDPWIEMQYCANPAADEWKRVSLRDETADLTERGVLTFSLPERTVRSTRFGSDRHWLRIRLTGDEFARSESGLFRSTAPPDPQTGHAELASISIADREQRQRTLTPPVAAGIHMNAVWAENTETVRRKSVGSSDETADQSFAIGDSPILSAEVWVEESDALSERDRERLQRDDGIRVRTETAPDGTQTAFWVEWTATEDFFDADGASRVYSLSRSSGEIKFGDGDRGAIPPPGEDNVAVTYRLGGGDDGNVGKGAVTGLVAQEPLVESVTNPVAAVRGEDPETTSEFVSRAPKRLRDRDRPVTRDGFERIAGSAARGIATVNCNAGEAETGAVGHVTLLVVPDTGTAKPVPSEQLLTTVEETIRERVPVAVSGSKLTVRGPSYLELSVEATVQTDCRQSTTGVQETVVETLTEFTHPLTGGPDGDGWAIGTVPSPGDCVARLERLDWVTHVMNLSVTYDGARADATLFAGEGAPSVPRDVLVYSGRHAVRVEMAGRTDGN